MDDNDRDDKPPEPGETNDDGTLKDDDNGSTADTNADVALGNRDREDSDDRPESEREQDGPRTD